MTDTELPGRVGRTLRIGKYRFAFTWDHKWECSDCKVGRGVAGHWTPIHAWLACRKWARYPATPE